MLNNDLTQSNTDQLESQDINNYYEELTPLNINQMLSPLNQNHYSDTFSQSYNQQSLKQQLQESLSVSKRFSNNHGSYEDNNNIHNEQIFQQQNRKNDQQITTSPKKPKVLRADQITLKQSEHHKSFSSYQLQHSLSQSGSTQPFSSPKKKFSSAISNSSNNNTSQPISQRPSYIQQTINSQVEQQNQQNKDRYEEQNQDEYNVRNEENQFHQLVNKNQANNFQDTLHIQQQEMGTTNGNALNYQTASFGSNLKLIERFAKNDNKQKEDSPIKATINDPMYGTFTDLNISDNKLIISPEIRAKLLDTQSNWKIRTEAIDQVLLILQQQMNENPLKLSSQAEQLIEFFLQLLNDQNFKIILTTLMIINKLLSLSLVEGNNNAMTSQQLGRFVPQFIKKLGDSKNIIRQEGVRGLITIYEIMRLGEKSKNNLIALLLPYLNNSANWHIREELLNVFILCFLKSRNFYDFDSMQIIEAFVLLLNDQKDKVRLMAKEALVTYASIGNKFSFKEIIFQICESSQKQEILERLDQDMIPFINQDGALELPYLEFIDNQVRDQTVVGSQHNVQQFVLPNLSRRDSMSSNTHKSNIPKSNNSSNQRQPSRGNSSGRRIVPPSANSIANYANQQGKRTVSANNIKQDNDSYYDQSPALSQKLVPNDRQMFQNNTHFGFLPSLNKAQSQQYQNTYYSQNNSVINNNQSYMQQLKMQKQMHSDNQVYSANAGQRQNHLFQQHQLYNQNSFKLPSNDNTLQGFGNLHKGVHSAHSYQQHVQDPFFARENIYNQNQGFLNQLQQNQNLFELNQSSNNQETIAYNGKQSIINPYESKQSSKILTSNNPTPIKKQQNTFYSDGSLTTTTTSIPDKIKQLRANKRVNIGNINEQSKRNIQIIGHNNSIINGSMDTSDINNISQSEIKNQLSILSNQRGPVRAKHHQQPDNNQNSQDNLQNLCIDNRKPKKKSVIKNTDLQEILEETKNQDYGTTKKESSSQLKRNNFGQTEYDESQQKYTATEDLEPLDNPEKDLKKVSNNMLGSDDWSIAFEGCCIVRRLCKHHSSVILQQSGMLGGIVAQIIKIADSLRSSLSKIALLTINDMFTFLKRCMEPFLDNLCKILFKRSADTNTFISQTAEQALQSLCQNCQDTKVLQILLQQNVNAKSNPLRQKICKCLQTLVRVLGNSILFFKENDKLLSQLANYLSDACSEVRNIAKQSFIDLSKSIMGQNDRERLLQRVLNETQLKKVKDLLDREPAYWTNNSQIQSDFVIINANQHLLQNKRQSQSKLNNNKGQLRSSSLNKSNIQSQDDQPLNIQATKIIKPSQIKKRASQQDVISPMKEKAVLDSFFLDTLKELIMQTQTQDWKNKLDSINALYDYIDQNRNIFQTKTSTKFVELSDTLSQLLSDQNAKIQQQSLDRFLQVLPKIQYFVEQYIVTFYQSLTSNLASSNSQVKKMSESILLQLNEQIADKTVIITPLLSQIQFNSNVRLKPLLIEQLSELIPSISQQKQNYIIKTILPVSLKLLDDNRSEVKNKTDRLLKTIYLSIGQQMLDSCPQSKLQKLCDIVLSNAQLSNQGIATFGAQSINGLLKATNM